MILISHRGNITGPASCIENSPRAIDFALKMGFECEVDLYLKDGKIMLGHDEGKYQVNESFLVERREKLWIHCKNFEALEFFFSSKGAYDFFWHQTDDYTLTSKGYVWVYPGKKILNSSIWVLPELHFDSRQIEENTRSTDLTGICTDYPLKYGAILP